MSRSLLVAAFLMGTLFSKAQPFGNEWINYNARYWTFPVLASGVYRIDSLTLANAGFPLDEVDVRTIQIFGRDKQVPLYITGDTDGVLNAADRIEFYAPANDAWLDSALWDDPARMNNPAYSLISDRIQYFVTWNAAPVTERVKVYQHTITGLTPRPWVKYHTRLTFNNYYRGGEQDGLGVSTSLTSNGEGYFGIPFQTDNADLVTVFNVPVPGRYTGGITDSISVDVGLASSNSASKNSEIDHHMHLRAGNYNVSVSDTMFQGRKTLRFSKNISYIQIQDVTMPVRVYILHDLFPNHPALGADYPDAMMMAYIDVGYQHVPDFSGYGSADLFFKNTALNDPIHLANGGIGPGQQFMYVWGDTLRRVEATYDGLWHTVLPADAAHRETHAFAACDGSVFTVGGLLQVNGNGLFTDFSALATDSAMLIVSDTTLMTGALEYAAYRNNGNTQNHYNTVVADVGELYQQFGGGIPFHPMGIRRFVDFALHTYPTPPKALFLIGKSIQSAHSANFGDGQGTRKSLVAQAATRVPSFGYPPSDNLFTLGLSGDPADLTVPVGRLAARSVDDVERYLNKVRTLEEQQRTPAAWMKNILHFRGGFTDDDFAQFGWALGYFAGIAEDTCFGGHVTTFVKSNGFLSNSAADSVYDKVAEGVTMMTFFAHANGGGFDITLDQPPNYQWNGHYPLMVGISCYTGNFHLLSSASASEQFVTPITPDVGAIGFLSSIDLGVSSYLTYYVGEFYRSFSLTHYGSGIGQHIRSAIHAQLEGNANEWGYLACAQQFSLHGDPTVVLNSPELPDYEIHASDVKLSPDPVTADEDSFDVHVTIRNIGRATGAEFPVAVERTLVEEGASLQPSIQLHSMAHWQDTLVFTLPTLVDSGGQGLNQLEVRVDKDPDLVIEAEEDTNNVASTQFLMTTGDLVPIYPYEYAITPDASPLLQASTGDPFAPLRNYIFQVDTTDLFNSPVMEQGTVSGAGGVIEWQPSFIFNLNDQRDSIVYFWRCTVDSVGNGEYDWHEFSFQHITGKRGWGQSHYFQFKKDQYNLITYDRPQRDFDFDNSQHNIGCLVWGDNTQQVKWTKDLSVQEGQGCGSTAALHVCVVDPYDFSSWYTHYGSENPDHSFGNVNDNGACRQRAEAYFIFREDNADQLNAMADMLLNDIPDGYYVLVYTYRFVNKDPQWAAFQNVMSAMGTLGADSLAQNLVPDSVPYIFFCRKGDLASAQEQAGITRTSQIDMSVWVSLNGRSGTIVAPIAGPAYTWNALYWDERPVNPQDSTWIRLSGINGQGVELPIANVPSIQDSIAPLTAPFPYLRVSGLFQDDSTQVAKPAQMKRWQLLGAPVPECAIDPPLGFVEHIDSLYEGQSAEVMVAIHNVSEFNMDSLLIGAWVVDEANQKRIVHYVHHAPLPAGGVLLDTLRFNTAGLGGLNTLIIEANPKDTSTHVYDQLEQYHFNNIAVLRFETLKDLENPMLDVTFDGMHIIDGDVVSAKPEIQITLNDENETLLLDSPADTANFKVFLKRPNANEYEQLRFVQGGVEVLHFVPANGPDNVCKILYHPDLMTDGIYQMMVRATDISRNNSGDHDYTVRFEVINRPTITEVLNYPNPFTTSTRFVFTLTGSEVPSAMRIQIMNISGRVVRDIGMDELGSLHMGRNITEFAWDGTDQFGDRLARGVYLYRVLAQLHGQDMELRETKAAGYFTQGFGKMYLLR